MHGWFRSCRGTCVLRLSAKRVIRGTGGADGADPALCGELPAGNPCRSCTPPVGLLLHFRSAFGIRGNPLLPVTQMSRNQPCSCGSGKRYKHCCGADPAPIAGAPGIEAPADVAPVCALPELMQRPLTAQMEGKLEEAQALYRQALQRSPADFHALHMLGVVRLQRGDPEEAVRHIVRAIRLGTVDYPPIYDNLVLCLHNIAHRGGSLAGLLDAAAPAPEAPRIHFARDVAAFAAEPPLVSVLLRCSDDDVARFAPGLEVAVPADAPASRVRARHREARHARFRGHRHAARGSRVCAASLARGGGGPDAERLRRSGARALRGGVRARRRTRCRPYRAAGAPARGVRRAAGASAGSGSPTRRGGACATATTRGPMR